MTTRNSEALIINAYRFQTPSITANLVKAALDQTLYGKAMSSLPKTLEYLALVDLFTADPAFPQGEHSRTIALGTILADTITSELLRHRHALGICDLETNSSMKSALQAIARDAQTANRELIGWSWLYYRYVRVELCLSIQEFCRAGHLNERTLRRYQAHVLQRLTAKLIDQEWKAQQVASSF